MHSRSFPALVPFTLLALSAAACTATLTSPMSGTDPNGTTPATNQGAPASAPDLGKACTAACDSGKSGVRCASISNDCSNKFCLVAPSKVDGSLAPIAYCSAGCESLACAAGYRCETIKDFSGTTNDRACVANPEACGNGIVELGEACDGPKDGRECSADCKSLGAAPGICGDGKLDVGEECDGAGADPWCTAACRVGAISVRFSDEDMSVDAGGSRLALSDMWPGGTLPVVGQADGCGSLQATDLTAEYLRLEWRYCNARGAQTTWRFGLLRGNNQERKLADLPSALQPSVKTETPDGNLLIELLPADLTKGWVYAQSKFPSGAPSKVGGVLDFVHTKPGVGRSKFFATYRVEPPAAL